MNPRGIQEFYYTRTLPQNAVAIAQVKAAPALVPDLIDVTNPVTVGGLGIWRWSHDLAGPVDDLTQPAHWSAVGLNLSVSISGSRTYCLDSQFFELTNKNAADGTPLYYCHPFDSTASSITILDASGNSVSTPSLVSNGNLYHSLDGQLYWIRYIDNAGLLQKEMLNYNPVIGMTTVAPTETEFTTAGRLLEVYDVTAYSIRFTAYSCFQVLVPYGAPPNTPWFSRIRFPLTPSLPEWGQQPFLPEQPYLLASWVPGVVLDPHVVQFERRNLYDDPMRSPDVLVFDSNYQFRFALEGTDPTLAQARGTTYPWKRDQINDVDQHTGMVQITPAMNPDDIVYGFYPYWEQDVLFTGIDCNPFTNPAIRNCLIRFYSRTDSDPLRRIYYQVLDFSGNDVPGATNDPNPVPGTWSNTDITLIGDAYIGASASAKDFTVTDIRQRGGGLATQYQDIPQAANFWDIGFIDGKPYPIGGALVVYLPKSILDRMSRTDVQGRIDKTIPLGVLAIVRYIDENLQEWN
jgi:hypothetical protein